MFAFAFVCVCVCVCLCVCVESLTTLSFSHTKALSVSLSRSHSYIFFVADLCHKLFCVHLCVVLCTCPKTPALPVSRPLPRHHSIRRVASRQRFNRHQDLPTEAGQHTHARRMMRGYAAWDRIAAEISDDDDDGDVGENNKVDAAGKLHEDRREVDAARCQSGGDAVPGNKFQRRVGGAVGETIESSYGNGKAGAGSSRFVGGKGEIDLMVRDWYEVHGDVRVNSGAPAPSVRVELGWPPGMSRGDFRYDSVSCKFTEDCIRLEVRDAEGVGRGDDATVFRFHRERLPSKIVPGKCSFRFGCGPKPSRSSLCFFLEMNFVLSDSSYDCPTTHTTHTHTG